MPNYSINISGSGTADEIIKSLESIIQSIKEKNPDNDPFFVETTFEDPTLIAEFSIMDEMEENEGIF